MTITGTESAYIIFIIVVIFLGGLLIGYSIDQIKKSNKELDTLSRADILLEEAEEFRQRASTHLDMCKELVKELEERLENGT